MNEEVLEKRVETRLENMRSIDSASAHYHIANKEDETLHFNVYVRANKVSINPHHKLGKILTVRSSTMDKWDYELLFIVEPEEV